MMPIQRACDAANQVRNKLSMDRGGCSQMCFYTEYSATRWHASVAGDMMVFAKRIGFPMNSSGHRG